MEWTDLDELILNNLGDLDAAANRTLILQDRLLGEIFEVVEHWCAERDWIVKHNLEDDSLWFAPAEWKLEGGRGLNADAWFNWEFDDEDDYTAGDDHWALTRLARAGRGVTGFRLRQSRRAKKEWKVQLRNGGTAAAFAAFKMDDEPSLFLPLILHKSALILAMKDGDFDVVLAPLYVALDQLEAIAPTVSGWLGPRQV